MRYTLTISSNRKRYPVKYSMLTQHVQSTCMSIYEYLMDANRTNLEKAKSERLELQTKAVTACDKLSCYAEVSMGLGLIGTNTAAHWQSQINDVKYMTIAWRSKDRTR